MHFPIQYPFPASQAQFQSYYLEPMLMPSSLPSPPADEPKPAAMSRKSLHLSKTQKPAHRASKRTNSSSSIAHHDHIAHSIGLDGRHKRVWKACERCRMKKTKCDGEFPCKRCKDDGLICAAGIRKKMEYKQLPKGYAEVLENAQFTLIATVHKLYSMVRNQQRWELGEPEFNDHGEPVVHNIAQKLGCIRPNSDIDLPVHSIFPEDEAGMIELARQLEGQQHEAEAKKAKEAQGHGSPHYANTDRASSSDLDHSDIEFNQRRAAFEGYGGGSTTSGSGSGSGSNSNTLAMSPQSFAGSASFDFGNPAATADLGATPAGLFPTQSGAYQGWGATKTQTPEELSLQFLRQPGMTQTLDGLPRPVMDSGDYGMIRPNMLTACGNPGLMMGMSDPTMYDGFDNDELPL